MSVDRKLELRALGDSATGEVSRAERAAANLTGKREYGSVSPLTTQIDQRGLVPAEGNGEPMNVASRCQQLRWLEVTRKG